MNIQEGHRLFSFTQTPADSEKVVVTPEDSPQIIEAFMSLLRLHRAETAANDSTYCSECGYIYTEEVDDYCPSVLLFVKAMQYKTYRKGPPMTGTPPLRKPPSLPRTTILCTLDHETGVVLVRDGEGYWNGCNFEGEYRSISNSAFFRVKEWSLLFDPREEANHG